MAQTIVHIGHGKTGSSAIQSFLALNVDLLREFSVQLCVYGHLHAMQPGTYPDGVFDGIEFRCVSVDLVDFTPQLLVR